MPLFTFLVNPLYQWFNMYLHKTYMNAMVSPITQSATASYFVVTKVIGKKTQKCFLPLTLCSCIYIAIHIYLCVFTLLCFYIHTYTQIMGGSLCPTEKDNPKCYHLNILFYSYWFSGLKYNIKTFIFHITGEEKILPILSWIFWLLIHDKLCLKYQHIIDETEMYLTFSILTYSREVSRNQLLV